MSIPQEEEYTSYRASLLHALTCNLAVLEKQHLVHGKEQRIALDNLFDDSVRLCLIYEELTVPGLEIRPYWVRLGTLVPKMGKKEGKGNWRWREHQT